MQMTLVLIEDDAADAYLVRDMLSDVLPDHVVITFTTLADALERSPSDPVCVLLDLALPDAFGLEGLEQTTRKLPDVPIVVLTGRIDASTGPEALANGAQDYLVKGELNSRMLERSIRYAIERGNAQRAQRDLVSAELRAMENSRLERGLLPTPLVHGSGLHIASTYRPGRERALLGGDLYDLVRSPDGAVHALIGDVSGHGPDEAALGVAVRIAWRTLVMAGLSPDDVLRGAERVLLVERGDDERFATCAMISISQDRLSVEVRLAGHPPPIMIEPGGKVHLLDKARPAPPLGLMETAAIPVHSETLASEWTIMLYTDGLIEGTVCPDSKTRLGLEGLVTLVEEQLHAIGESGYDSLGPRLVEEVQSRQGGPLTDDVAVLVFGTMDRVSHEK